MRLLIDTNVLIWAGHAPHRLSVDARAMIGDTDNVVCFSAISVAEVAIKFALGRPDFTIDPADFRQELRNNGYDELPLTGAHAVRLRELPRIHRDPFDRLLVAQALVEGLTLVTSDPLVARYSGAIMLV